MLELNLRLSQDSISGTLQDGVAVFDDALTESAQVELLSWLNCYWDLAARSGRGLSPRGGAKFVPKSDELVAEEEYAFPEWAERLARSLAEPGFFPAAPNFGYVVRYPASVGMAPHEDRPIFGDTVVGLTVGSVAKMLVQSKQDHTLSCEMLLKPGSLYVLGPKVRWGFTHGLAEGETLTFRGQTYRRLTRFAVTFRNRLESEGTTNRE